MEEIITQIVTIFVLIYLFLGIRLSCKGIFKLILFIQVLSDIFLVSSWETLNTYYFIRYISGADHLSAIVFLTISLFLMDFPELFFNRGKYFKSPFDLGVFQKYVQSSKSFAISMLIFGLIVKMIELSTSGILSGRDVSTYKPEDSVGLYFLSVADFLIPFSLAMLYNPGKNKSRFPIIEIVILFLLSYFSFSKAAILIYFAVYAPTLAVVFGVNLLKKIFLKPILIPIIIGMAIFFGIKSQQRSNLVVSIQPDTIFKFALDGVGSRFGAIYRTFVVVNREIQLNEKATLEGYYNSQVFYLWIPRFLWTEKPRVASELLYDYLGVSEENYGTAFAINVFGTFLVDFGSKIAYLLAFVFGFIIYFGDRALERLVGSNISMIKIFVAILWINFSFSLAEGGIPPGFTKALILIAAYFLCNFLNIFVVTPILKITHLYEDTSFQKT